jgi:hypothetical protein
MPILGIHKNAISKWPLYPQYIREAFVRAFGYEQLHGVKPRLMEKEWLDIFIRLRSEIMQCGCGREIFADPEKGATCKCGRRIRIPACMKLKKLSIPLFPSQNLYACHTASDSEDFRTVTAEVVASKNNPGNMGIKNLSDMSWYVTGADGKPVPKSRDEVVKIAGGLTVNFGKDITAEICGNQKGV